MNSTNVYNPAGMSDVRGGVGMIHTQSYRNPKFMSTFTGAVLRRYPGGNCPVTAIIESMSTSDITTVDTHSEVQNVAYPVYNIVESVPAASPRQASTIKVNTTKFILPNTLFAVMPFGELMMVTGVTGDNTITVMRGMGSILPFAIEKGTALQFAGNAFQEGSLRPLGRHYEESRLWNQTQIFRDGWALTDTMRRVATANGVKVDATSKNDAAYQHSMAMEMSVLFGQKGNTVYKGQPMRTMSGMFEFIRANAPQNVITVGKSEVNYRDLCAIMEVFGDVRIGANPSTRRIIYGDKTFVNTITEIGMKYANMIRYTSDGTDSFGHRYRNFITPRMEFTVYEHPLFNLLNNMPRGMAIVVDPTSWGLKYLRRTRHTYFNADAGGTIQNLTVDNGIDAMGGDYLTEMALDCINPAANGVIYNFVSGGCSNEC